MEHVKNNPWHLFTYSFSWLIPIMHIIQAGDVTPHSTIVLLPQIWDWSSSSCHVALTSPIHQSNHLPQSLLVLAICSQYSYKYKQMIEVICFFYQEVWKTEFYLLLTGAAPCGRLSLMNVIFSLYCHWLRNDTKTLKLKFWEQDC